MKKFLRMGALLLALSVSLNMTALAKAADTAEFNDVKEDDYFQPAVVWGVENGITNGVGDNLFDPEGEVTRAQVVTFLWRMVGQPDYETAETFTDVQKGSWYEEAVKWATAEEVTLGTGEGLFSPDATCSRAMCITLLYRIMGEPLDGIDTTAQVELDEDTEIENFGVYLVQELINRIRTENLFKDVPEGSYYELPVMWGLLNSVITEDNTGAMEEGVLFRSDDPCVRKEMISFLYQTKLAQDAANAPETYEVGGITVPIPQEYSDRVFRDIYATNDDEDGVLMVVSERKSVEAAKALGEDAEGIGELFRIERVSEDAMHDMLCNDMSGVEIIGMDKENYNYYLLRTPTDVRYERETPEKMKEDQDEWTELNKWVHGSLAGDILEASSGITKVAFTNTSLDIRLANIAYKGDTNYTISTTEFGPLEPSDVDATPYVEALLGGNFAEVEDAEVPDGEYVVLTFPEDDVRYDFFTSDKSLVREVRGDYETFYRCVYEGEESNNDIMQKWYDEIAVKAGKKSAE